MSLATPPDEFAALYQPPGFIDDLGVPSEPTLGPILVCMADVEARQVSWLWPDRFPLGRISLLVGRPGEGKSYLTLDMAARISTGSPWPDGSECPAGSVLLISGEDVAAETIRPRLDALGADPRFIHQLAMVRRPAPDGGTRDVVFSLADVSALETSLKRLPDCQMIVIDPIGSYVGGDIDAHRDNEVRGVLAPVAALAEKYGPAVVVVAHRRKSAASSADDLALGSRAFTGIARTVWHLSRDPNVRTRRLLLPGKNNLAPEGHGLGFVIGGDPPRLLWEADPVTMTADEGLAIEQGGGGEDGPGRPATERTAAEQWLKAELADGMPHPVATLRDDCIQAGLTWRTVQRAADELAVERTRAGFQGGWTWRLE